MKRSEIRDQVRFLSLIEEREVSDSQLDTLIDEGYDVIEGREAWTWATVPKPALVQTTVGADRYLIPSFTHILAVIGRESGLQLRSVSRQELALNAWEKYGTPEIFTVEGRKIVLSPIPDETCQNFDVVYTAKGAWNPEDDSPPFESEFHSMLADWALHRLWEREEDFDRSDRYRSRFEARLSDMNHFYSTRTKDRPLIFGVSSRDIRQPLRHSQHSSTVKENT